jgi:hypothetical protein
MSMSSFHVLEPEVAGELGDQAVCDYSVKPFKVVKLQFRFTVWLGDDLLTAHPCFIVTERLRKAMESFAGTGYSFETLDIEIPEDFYEISDVDALPPFHWLKLNGQAGIDDAGYSPKWKTLVVSDRLLRILQSCNIANCLIRKKPFVSDMKP